MILPQRGTALAAATTMTARMARTCLLMLALGGLPSAATALAAQPDEARLRAEVARLSAPEFLGRRDEGGRKAADHLVETFKRYGLSPLFGRDYVQPIIDRQTGQPIGRNVGAKVIGTDPALRDEWLIVSAHFDHLGVRNGVLYPGADDNASGVAMMLELARLIGQPGAAPRRSIMFIGFDLEEAGLFGSRYFVENSPVPLQRIALMITADMIGRSLGGVCTPYVFVMGTEHAPGVRPWLEQAAQGRPVSLGILGSDLLLLDRSDYGPFRARSIPYLFFSTGENPTYHTSMDVPETLDYPKLAAISGLIHDVVRRAGDADAVPRWSATPEHSISEAITIRSIVQTLLDKHEQLKIGPTQTLIMTNAMRRLDAIIARGTVLPGERGGLVNLARVVMFSVL